MPSLRLVFMGTPDFAVPSLTALAAAGHEIACVYTQPPRPAGRGHKERPSPVGALAATRGWPLRTPAGLTDPEVRRDFAALGADVAVVAAYGLILPGAVLEAPRLGCLNVHASLLPRWRGAAPIQRAIMAGDAVTGITLMRMDEGLDTGPILMRRELAMGGDDAGALHDKLSALGAAMIVDGLDALAAGRLDATPQPDAGATYAEKLTRADEAIDWTRPAVDVARQVRALAPRPGAHFTLGGETWKVLAAALDRDGAKAPGTVLDDRLRVACGDGALRLLTVQRPGRKAMAAADALRGHAVPPGTRLG